MSNYHHKQPKLGKKNLEWFYCTEKQKEIK